MFRKHITKVRIMTLINTCKECGREHSRKKSKYCSVACAKEQSKKPEIRNKISEARKKYLKENPDKHPWKNETKKISVPCEKLKEYLTSKNINYVDEWQPLEDRFFSIDVAFPDLKIGIEVNGNQHYNSDGTLKAYYQQRHDLIEASGWKLIELHYSSCFNDEKLQVVLSMKTQPDYSEYFKLKEEKRKKKQVLPKGQKLKNKTDVRWQPHKQIVIESGIDFSKFGWVKEVAKILGIKDQKVNIWMKRYLPDFYEQNCFKRKAGVSQRISTPSLKG